MSSGLSPTWEWIKDIGLPVGGFVVGFLTSRWTLSKKERKDFEQKNYENTTALIAQFDAAYDAYTRALRAYIEAPTANGSDFYEVATKGDRYLVIINLISGAILSDKVDTQLRDEVLLAKVRDAFARTLPQHYEALQKIAAKHGFAFSGELRREDYGAIYGVIDKFGPTPGWVETT